MSEGALMDEEGWAELLKLREKASLTPKTDYRFQSLEIYLSAIHTLNIFSKDKERLLSQLNELSEHDKESLLSRVTNKTMPSFFHLTHEEMEKLQAARKELSFHERARLLSNLILTATGTAWLDLGEVFDAIIEIDDRSSPEREARPYAHIYSTDHYRRRVETIDIIGAVKSDPMTIGHPAIAFAIYHWQQVIYTKRVIERQDITSRDTLGRSFKDEFGGGRDVRSAESNLMAISQTLYDAAKERMIPLESAFALKMQWCGLLPEGEGSVVYKAWENLKADAIGKLDDPDEILKKLEPELTACERVLKQTRQPIYAHRVMEFLQDNGEKGGKRFVGFDKDGNSPRPRWVVFRNAFAAWFFDLEQSAVQKYLERARRQDVAVNEVYEPSMVYPKTTVARILHYLLTKPLVTIREPVLLNEADIELDDIEKAINKVSSDTE
jgi:hypothetical protein